MCCAFHIQFTQRLRTCTAPSTTRHISPKWIPSPPLSCISTTAFSAWQADGADAQGLMHARTRVRCLFLWKRGICVKRIFNNLKKNKQKKSLKKKKKRIQLRLCFLEGKKKVSAGELLRVFQPRWSDCHVPSCQNDGWLCGECQLCFCW